MRSRDSGLEIVLGNLAVGEGQGRKGPRLHRGGGGGGPWEREAQRMLGTEAETMGMFPSWGKTGNYVVVKSVAKPAIKMVPWPTDPQQESSLDGRVLKKCLQREEHPPPLTGRTPSLQLCSSQPPSLLPSSLEHWGLDAPSIHAAIF